MSDTQSDGHAQQGKISLDKKRETPAAATTGAPAGPPPKHVRYAVIALAVTAVAALIASLSLFFLKSYLLATVLKANAKLKAGDRKSTADLMHTVSVQPTASLIQSVIVLLALGFAGRGVWKGRYWARWAVIGLWVLATFTQIVGGLFGLTAAFTSGPIVLRAAAFIAAAAFATAAFLVNVRPSVTYFNLSRPTRPEPGAAPARRGLFAPRDPVRAQRQGYAPPRAGRSKVRTSAAAATDELFRGDSNTERARAKQRANADSVARGADLARARAKAGKSRRNGV